MYLNVRFNESSSLNDSKLLSLKNEDSLKGCDTPWVTLLTYYINNVTQGLLEVCDTVIPPARGYHTPPTGYTLSGGVLKLFFWGGGLNTPPPAGGVNNVGCDTPLAGGITVSHPSNSPCMDTLLIIRRPCFLYSRKLLLLPVGTATVERSFSTMNRILSSQRCRLLPSHACQLMQLSIEGPGVVDVRDGTESEEQALHSLIDNAYVKWLEQPRRGLV